MQVQGLPLLRSRFRRNRTVLYGGVAGIILVAVITAQIILNHLHEEAEERAATVTQNLTQSVEQTIDGMIDTIDVALLASADEIGRQIAAGKVDADSITRFLLRQKDRLRNIAFLRATNERGDVVYGPGIPSLPANNSDREFFIRLRDNPNAGLFVAKPIIGRIAQKWLWSFARRINKPDGSFGGVVFASIYLDELEKILSQIKLDTGSVISIRDSELGLIARSTSDTTNPVPPGDKRLSNTFREALKANPREGTFISDKTTPDGISRTYSYHRNDGYGFMVNVGLARAPMLAEWRYQTWTAAALVASLALLMLLVARLIDRTWRRQEEDLILLEFSEQRFRAIIETSPIPFALNDDRQNITYLNPAFTQTFGYRRDDIPTLAAWWPKAYPDPAYRQEVATSWQAHLNKAKSGNMPFEPLQVNICCKGGDVRTVLVSATSLSTAFEQVHLVTCFDITERMQMEAALQESEARFRSMFENNASVMLLIDPDSGEVVDANDAAACFYGYPIERLKAMRIEQINTLSPDEIAARRNQVVLRNSNTFTFPHRLADGKVRTVEVRSSAIRVTGRVLLFSIINDITEREMATAELKRSNAELEQFSYAVSHDMRQPLRMISSYLQLLEDAFSEQLDNEKREFFDFAIDGAKRLDKMLVALLEYSRVGRMGEPPTWVESRNLRDEILLLLQPMISEAKAVVHIEGEWPRVFVSPDEILRLLQNLIGNALKFRIAGRMPEITLSSETSASEWRLRVADNGVGIIPDQIGRLFQVFQRLQARTAYEGTGVGLALCRKIAEHHGGRIWAESAGTGQGSRFCVILPLRTEAEK
jgi:PAS domain S-box-containing protein